MEINVWYSVKEDGAPPFDRIVLVRGQHPEYGHSVYAIAYNECYRPEMNMRQVVESDERLTLEIPFAIEEWMLLE